MVFSAPTKDLLDEVLRFHPRDQNVAVDYQLEMAERSLSHRVLKWGPVCLPVDRTPVLAQDRSRRLDQPFEPDSAWASGREHRPGMQCVGLGILFAGPG